MSPPPGEEISTTRSFLRNHAHVWRRLERVDALDVLPLGRGRARLVARLLVLPRDLRFLVFFFLCFGGRGFGSGGNPKTPSNSLTGAVLTKREKKERKIQHVGHLGNKKRARDADSIDSRRRGSARPQPDRDVIGVSAVVVAALEPGVVPPRVERLHERVARRIHELDPESIIRIIRIMRMILMILIILIIICKAFQANTGQSGDARAFFCVVLFFPTGAVLRFDSRDSAVGEKGVALASAKASNLSTTFWMAAACAQFARPLSKRGGERPRSIQGGRTFLRVAKRHSFERKNKKKKDATKLACSSRPADRRSACIKPSLRRCTFWRKHKTTRVSSFLLLLSRRL